MFDKSVSRSDELVCKMKTNPATKIPADLERVNMKCKYDVLLEDNLPYNIFNKATEKCKIMTADISSKVNTIRKEETDKLTSMMERTKEKGEIFSVGNDENTIISNNEIVIIHQTRDENTNCEHDIVKEDDKSSNLLKMQKKQGEEEEEDTDSENESDDSDVDSISNVQSQIDAPTKDCANDEKETETREKLLKTNTSKSDTVETEERLKRLEITPSKEESKDAEKKDNSEDIKEKLIVKPSLKLNIPTEPISEVEEKLNKLTIRSVKEIKETGELIERSPMKGHVGPTTHVRTSTKPYAISSHTLQSGGGIIAHIAAPSPTPNNAYLQTNVNFNISAFSPASSPESNISLLPPSPQFPFVQEQYQSETPLRELTQNDIDEVLSHINDNNNNSGQLEHNKSDAVVPCPLEAELLDYFINSPSFFHETVPDNNISSSVANTMQQTVSDNLSPAVEGSFIQLPMQYRQNKSSFAGSVSSPGTTFSSSGSPFPSDSSSPICSPIPSPCDSYISTSELGRSVTNLTLPTGYSSLSDVSDSSNISLATTDDSSVSSGIQHSSNSINNSQFICINNNESSCSSFTTEIDLNGQIYSVSSGGLLQNNENVPKTQFLLTNNFTTNNGQSSNQLQSLIQSNGILIQENQPYRILSTAQNNIGIENSKSSQETESAVATNINSFTHSISTNIQHHQFLSPNIPIGSTNTPQSMSNSELHFNSKSNTGIHVQRMQTPSQSSPVQAKPVQHQLQQTVPATNVNPLPNYTFAMPLVLQNVTVTKPAGSRPLVAIQEGSYIPNIQPKSAKERFPEKLNRKVQLQTRVRLTQLPDEVLTKADEDGDTQLLIAASNPDQENGKELIYELINRIKNIPGALNARNKLNQSALLLASMNWTKEPLVPRLIAETLLENNLNIDETYEDGNSVIHHLCKQGKSHLDVLTELLSIRNSNGMPYFDINRYNHQEGSTLHTAVKSHSKNVDSKSTVRLLLSQGANVLDKERCSGQTPLHVAIRESCCPEMVRILLQDSARRNIVIVNEKDYSGDMPLHYAASRNDVQVRRQAKVVELLMQYGAVSNRTGSIGKMPLALVASERKNDIQNIIRKK